MILSEKEDELSKKRHCHVCGKLLKCDCYYADYGLVKFDNSGRAYIEFDACPECLDKVIATLKENLKVRKDR